MASADFDMAVPSSPFDVDVLNCQYSSNSGWEELFDYGELRYHLLLDANKDRLGVQHELLAQLGRAVEDDDDDEVQRWADECRKLMWPLIHHDYTSRPVPCENSVFRIETRRIDKFENTKKMASILILKFGFLQVKMKRTDLYNG